MKASRLIFTLLLASSVAVVQLAAQQTKADQKPIGEVKAKAEAGDAESEAELGLRYEQGKGVAKDQVEAYEWLLLAARQGDEDAKKNMTELETKLTPEQIAERQKRARDFIPR